VCSGIAGAVGWCRSRRRQQEGIYGIHGVGGIDGLGGIDGVVGTDGI
jgi:hypothetical protein